VEYVLQARNQVERDEWLSACREQLSKLKESDIIKLITEFKQKEEVTFLLRSGDNILSSGLTQTVTVINPRERKIKTSFDIQVPELDKVYVTYMTICGLYLCLAVSKYVIRVHAKTFIQSEVITGHTGTINSMTGLGRELWTASEDGTIRVWNINSCNCLKVISPGAGRIYCITSAASFIWCTAEDNTIRLYDDKAFFFIKQLEQKHQTTISSLAYTTVPYLSIWSGSWDKTFCVWNIPTI